MRVSPDPGIVTGLGAVLGAAETACPNGIGRRACGASPARGGGLCRRGSSDVEGKFDSRLLLRRRRHRRGAGRGGLGRIQGLEVFIFRVRKSVDLGDSGAVDGQRGPSRRQRRVERPRPVVLDGAPHGIRWSVARRRRRRVGRWRLRRRRSLLRRRRRREGRRRRRDDGGVVFAALGRLDVHGDGGAGFRVGVGVTIGIVVVVVRCKLVRRGPIHQLVLQRTLEAPPPRLVLGLLLASPLRLV
mmetsp:Transcript_5039/g.15939  ORF Transcript_5039/g.15939 Transcript_5039/m.15939 type:complete len:243 (-) Transcript_5039:102-830(-)